MKAIFRKGVYMGLAIALSMAGCSSGDGRGRSPPEPVYRYYAYVANSEFRTICPPIPSTLRRGP
ncbi:MAG: hypothetical protein M0C28_42070 [Candidatus Moduliflexus flocculans]|nr:hypothetical protein [Candidatus Moduliflexus flocculans]